ncbi:MAG TPA: hypothetical protein VE868_07970 [Balneolaceae bacterium]|nr:hypothetical protein [Balneolaceae bacterium]
MQNDENDVIRYLMKEMDPSEEVLMERAMMEDDDLLIEVESMRQTLHRLDEMPEKAPPAELTESIIREAGEYKRNSPPWQAIPAELLKYAAVLVIGMGLGSGLWMALSPTSSNKNPKTASAVSTSATSVNSAKSVKNAKSNTKPWVDRHNVIYYQDKFSRKASYQAMRQTSMQKLTPVNPSSTGMMRSSPAIHLTSDDQ